MTDNMQDLSDDDLDAHRQAIAHEQARREELTGALDQLRAATAAAKQNGLTHDEVRETVEEVLTR